MKIIASLAGAALVLALSACAAPAPTPVITPDPAAAPAPTATISPEEVAERESIRTSLAFGDVYTYTDGVSISVSAPGDFVPGEYAAGGGQAFNVIFNVTITNGSDSILEPSPFARVSAGGSEGATIFDTDQNVGMSPSTAILPGQSVTWMEGWSIADLNTIVFQISPSYEHQDSIFTNVN